MVDDDTRGLMLYNVGNVFCPQTDIDGAWLFTLPPRPVIAI